MKTRIIEKDFGGLIKWSIIGNAVYVDSCFLLELKRRTVCPEICNDLKDLLEGEQELLCYYRANPDIITYNMADMLNDVPIGAIKRILELTMQVMLEEEQEDAVEQCGGTNGKSGNIQSRFNKTTS